MSRVSARFHLHVCHNVNKHQQTSVCHIDFHQNGRWRTEILLWSTFLGGKEKICSFWSGLLSSVSELCAVSSENYYTDKYAWINCPSSICLDHWWSLRIQKTNGSLQCRCLLLSEKMHQLRMPDKGVCQLEKKRVKLSKGRSCLIYDDKMVGRIIVVIIMVSNFPIWQIGQVEYGRRSQASTSSRYMGD